MEDIDKINTSLMDKILKSDNHILNLSLNSNYRDFVEAYIRKYNIIKKTVVISDDISFWKEISRNLKVISKPSNAFDIYNADLIVLDKYNVSSVNTFIYKHEKKCIYINDCKITNRRCSAEWSKEDESYLLDNIDLDTKSLAEHLNKSMKKVSDKRYTLMNRFTGKKINTENKNNEVKAVNKIANEDKSIINKNQLNKSESNLIDDTEKNVDDTDTELENNINDNKNQVNESFDVDEINEHTSDPNIVLKSTSFSNDCINKLEEQEEISENNIDTDIENQSNIYDSHDQNNNTEALDDNSIENIENYFDINNIEEKQESTTIENVDENSDLAKENQSLQINDSVDDVVYNDENESPDGENQLQNFDDISFVTNIVKEQINALKIDRNETNNGLSKVENESHEEIKNTDYLLDTYVKNIIQNNNCVNKFSDEVLECIIKSYLMGLNYKKISEKTKLNIRSIRDCIYKNNLFSMRKKYLVDSVFDSVESAEKLKKIIDILVKNRELNKTAVITNKSKEYSCIFSNVNPTELKGFSNIIFDNPNKYCDYSNFEKCKVYIINCKENECSYAESNVKDNEMPNKVSNVKAYSKKSNENFINKILNKTHKFFKHNTKKSS